MDSIIVLFALEAVDYTIRRYTEDVKRTTALHIIKFLIAIAIIVIGTYQTMLKPQDPADSSTQNLPTVAYSPASAILQELPIKGRAPKTGYTRAQFGDGWLSSGGCDTRNRILARDMTAVVYEPTLQPVVCEVRSGVLHDPYTGSSISFTRGQATSAAVQIDHVVALSDAWQKGAQALTPEERVKLANDPLELLAVDGNANQAKSDGDAATWLPSNKSYRCSYVARQIAVKKKYSLWVTRSEYEAMVRVLNDCPGQVLPS